MLVLSRKPGELVHIGNNIELTVLKVRGQRVVVGLSAPEQVHIRRQEAPIQKDNSRGRSASSKIIDGKQVETRH